MTHIAIQDIEKKFINKKIPVLRPGYTVRVHHRIQEGEKKRIQIFEGIVIGLNSGRGSGKMATVRKIVEGVGVEKIFPLYSPVIAKIEIVKTPKIRRAKLYFLRGLVGKSSRLKTKLGLIEKDEIYSKKKMGTSNEEVKEETQSQEENPPSAQDNVAAENAAPAADQKEETAQK